MRPEKKNYLEKRAEAEKNNRRKLGTGSWKKNKNKTVKKGEQRENCFPMRRCGS